MNNQELLFNLIKELEKEGVEFRLVNNLDNAKTEFYLISNEGIDKKDGGRLVERIKLSEMSGQGALPYNEEWNKEFKENFYKEKGLDKCWVKDCPNKIYQKEGDYRKVKVSCKEKHTRMVCLECYNSHLEIFHPEIPKEK